MSDSVQPPVILNVSDDEAARGAVSRVLRQAGYEVRESGFGQEGLALRGDVPDLVVLDVNLSDPNGFDVCRIIKSDPRTSRIPVLQLTTGNPASHQPAKGLRNGADGYLALPVEADELIATITSLLRMHRAEDEAIEFGEQWKATCEAIREGVIVLDRAGRIARCNSAGASFLGTSAAEAIGTPVSGHAKAFPGLADAFAQLLAGASPAPCRASVEVEVPTKGASPPRWLRVSSKRVESESASGPACVLTIEDVTEHKDAEAANRQHLEDRRNFAVRQFMFMREALASVTDGRLALCQSADELPRYDSRIGSSAPVSARSLSDLRSRIKSAAADLGFDSRRGLDLLTAASEAGMNAAEHAGGGVAQIARTAEGALQVWITDRGSGIAVEYLPKATLSVGYTTAGTLGHGLKIMLQSVDHVWLLTGIGGTTVVLEQRRDPPKFEMTWMSHIGVSAGI